MELAKIKTIGNIGAGTMGHATALQFAMRGYQVNLLDTSKEALERGIDGIKNDIKTFQDAGMLTDTAETVLARIHTTTDYKTTLAGADFVIESVVEDMAVKQLVWQEAEKYVSDHTILATNTSGLSPTEIQSVLNKPERFVVAHFWNPAQLMPLVEVVPGKATSEATVSDTVALMNHIGKHAVPLKKESLGFVGNRIQLAVLREAFHIVDEGIATPEAVDDIIKYSLGRRWSLVGPIASADLGGLDVFKNISSYLYADLAADKGTDPLLDKMVSEGKLGLKTGQGFFPWTGEAGETIVNDRDTQLLKLLKEDSEQ
ncbi:3-hydroxyacyl-CoA dehydrogenase family protein [Secundilactobacillus paracollinoides]|uniref:L-gulonate 3-dehydrogenase n=2 Tax=Secundilactobacillus paracollinoides TaxID=240427 RepID=A0A1B2IVG2_9LACO|nr:3-hydroxyacyl-CoA dehydrogenase family protein [Secundilactobacillus paracollinoides]ANZ60215.1 3-hydroxybutyryl-CoA dehydrogenase [Secundilactobacillus paracollinoides]ANZ66009.1 3-hydroxybutyryl-CoA dehydrogenase [Secundilactobacillus paracollinoides]KRL79224.1 3-hydroxybutyryl-CoA dehydrogenase [Secundilactobacillus paracollinoides DSM 15502 = JCM 11969]